MKRINLTVPISWVDLSQDQLRFLLATIAQVGDTNHNTPFASLDDFSAQTSAQVATYCLLKWNNLQFVCPYADGWLLSYGGNEFCLDAETIASAISALSWINSLPEQPVRLEVVDGANALDADLDSGFSFDDWLSCENLWQHYQISHSEQPLIKMAEILYRKPGIKLSPAEMLGVFYWWAAVKLQASTLYPNFFRPADTTAPETTPTHDDIRKGMNAQIRALTKGDITKEEQILAMDASRALTELDALAFEYEELNRKYPSK